MPQDGTYYQRDRAWHPPALTPQYKTSILRAPQKALLSLETTISEMTGPVFGHDRLGPRDNDLITNFAKTGDAIGQRLIVHGRVLDQNGRGLPGVLVEFWQANAGGRYRHHQEGYRAALDPNFGGCGRPSPMPKAATISAPSSRAPIRGRTGSTTGGPPTSISRCSATPSPSGSSPRCTSKATR